MIWCVIRKQPLSLRQCAIALRRSDLGLLAILTVAYFLLISAGGESESRFRVPVVPQYAMLAAAGVEVVKRGAARPPR